MYQNRCIVTVKELSDRERQLYHWILRSFASGRKPEAADLQEAASRLGLELETALASLEERDLVLRDPGSGEIAVAYPFSGRPTAHEVRLDHGRPVYAMCAVDALGVPFMLGAAAEVVSRDPVTGEEVSVIVDPESGSRWSPEGAAVVWGSTGGPGPSAVTCCSIVNFFGSAKSAERYLREHPGVQGRVLSIPEALEEGRRIFGGLLDG